MVSHRGLHTPRSSSLLCGQPGGPLGRPAAAQGILLPPFSSLPLLSRSDEGKVRRRKEKEQEGGREDFILHKSNKLHMFCRRRWSARAVPALGPGTGVICSYASCCTYLLRVRWGCGRYPFRARKVWQAWQFLDASGCAWGCGRHPFRTRKARQARRILDVGNGAGSQTNQTS